MKYISKYLLYIAFLVIIILFIFGIKTPLFNDRWRREVQIVFHDGNPVFVDEYHSDPLELFGCHLFVIVLGKDQKDTYKWLKDSKFYVRETYFIPIIINEYDGITYIVELDLETDYSKKCFRFYIYKGEEWEEINCTEFPKILAVQNVITNKESRDIVLKMDPEDYWFRQSSTGRIWVLLETGKQYYQTQDDDSYTSYFFAEFKEKYITKKASTGTDTTPKDSNSQIPTPVKSKE